MSTITDPKRNSVSTARSLQVKGLKMTGVDVAASWLLSLLIVIGGIVFLLFVMFLTQTWTQGPGDIKIEEAIAGRGDHAEGYERDLEPPGSEEVEEFAEPPLERSFEAVTTAASTVAATFDNIESQANAIPKGAGRGDSRPPGPLGEGEDIIPRFERWELKFAAKSLSSYAMQLDFFNIELGCIGGGVENVDYAASFSKTSKKRRSGKGDLEKRLYFMWRQDGPLVVFDRQLLTQAGVEFQNRQILKFILPQLENRLAQIELTHAAKNGHSSVKEIAKTIFLSQPLAQSGFEFTVVDQRYRIAK